MLLHRRSFQASYTAAAAVATVLTIGVATGIAGPASAGATTGPSRGRAADTIGWGRVQTISKGSFDNLRSVTTDSGMVVAAWTGAGFSGVYVATRPDDGSWSAATRIPGSAAALDLSTDGAGAELAWQGFAKVRAAHVDPDGAVGAAQTVGASSDPFREELHVAAGAKGAVAVTWHTGNDAGASMLAYRRAGGDWEPAEQVPATDSVVALVVGSGGTAQLITASGAVQHQQLNYLRRTDQGRWRSPVEVSANAYLPTVAGNADGDLVVGWEIVNDDGTFSLAARYKAAEKKDFDPTERLDDNVPESSTIAFGMAADGSLAAAYRIAAAGDQQIQMTPADSTGVWLDPQNLGLTGSVYDVAMNSAGDFAVTSMSSDPGVQLVRCAAGNVCGSAETNPATKYTFPTVSLGPDAAVSLVWGRGCKGEECRPTKVVAQRGS